MFLAKLNNKSVTSQEIYEKYLDVKESRTGLKFETFYGDELIYVRKSISGTKPHFRFKVVPEWYRKKYKGGGESPTHFEAKMEIVKKIRDDGFNVIDEDYGIFNGERIPDISVYEDGQIIECHEIQLSPINVDEIKDRTNFYTSYGVGNVTWYFDNNATWWNVPEIKAFLMGHMETSIGVLTINVKHDN